MDKATAEIHDQTRKALMDRIVELESEIKTLKSQVSDDQDMLKKLFGENNALDKIIELQKGLIEKLLNK